MSDSIEPTVTTQPAVDEAPRYLVGVRLREPLLAEDYRSTETHLHVGAFVVVETGGGTAVGEVRRPRREIPEFKRGRMYRSVVRRATTGEVTDWRERRAREGRGGETPPPRAR